jgi:hypothetical protein
MTKNCKARIAFLNTHPIQYFAPSYPSLNVSEDMKVSAIYFSDYSLRGSYDAASGHNVKREVDPRSGYDAQFVAGADRCAN